MNVGLKECEGEKGRRRRRGREAKIGGWVSSDGWVGAVRSADLTLKWRGNGGYCGGSMGTQSQALPGPAISRSLGPFGV